MKNALLLSLALIAVGPVAVEGQADANDRFVDLLLQNRTCRMTDLSPTHSREECEYILNPGLHLSVFDDGTVMIYRVGEGFGLTKTPYSPHLAISFANSSNYAMAFLCTSPRRTGRWFTSLDDILDDCH